MPPRHGKGKKAPRRKKTTIPENLCKKALDKWETLRYYITRRRGKSSGVDRNPWLVAHQGSIAQLGEHLPYKQRVTGSSPVVPTMIFGPVAQLVRAPACHAGGRGFEPLPGRQYALVAQSVEQQTENLRVGGSIPPQGTVCGSSSVVECHLAKVDVAGPNPVYRSTKLTMPMLHSVGI